MEITFTEEETRALRRFLTRKAYAGDVSFTNVVYVPPAQALRNSANEIEQDERDAPVLKGILEKLN